MKTLKILAVAAALGSSASRRKKLAAINLAACLHFALAQPARAQSSAMDALMKEAGPEAAAILPPAPKPVAAEVALAQTTEEVVRARIDEVMRNYSAKVSALREWDRVRGGPIDSMKSLVDSQLTSLWTTALAPDAQNMPWEQVVSVINEMVPTDEILLSLHEEHFGWAYDDEGTYRNVYITSPAGDLGQLIPKAKNALAVIRDNRDYILARARLDKSPDEVFAESNPDVLAAARKLSGGNLSGESPYGTFTKDGKRGVLTKEKAMEDIRAAFGAVLESELPEEVRGFGTKDALTLIADWLGPEGLQKFQLRLTTQGKSSTTLYNMPMLNVWVQANATPLDRVLRQKWVQMPVEKAALWAWEEVAIRKGVPTDELATATPRALYVRRKDYPAFMALYTRDKRSLSGEEIANAINGFKAELVAKLEEIRQSQWDIAQTIAANTSATSAGLGAISADISGLREAINVDRLANILLRFAH